MLFWVQPSLKEPLITVIWSWKCAHRILVHAYHEYNLVERIFFCHYFTYFYWCPAAQNYVTQRCVIEQRDHILTDIRQTPRVHAIRKMEWMSNWMCLLTEAWLHPGGGRAVSPSVMRNHWNYIHWDPLSQLEVIPEGFWLILRREEIKLCKAQLHNMPWITEPWITGGWSACDL